MSWIVSHLLRNKTSIREKVLRTLDTDDEEYNDLLTIEKAIEELVEAKILKPKDVQILDSLSSGETFSRKDRSKTNPVKRFKFIARTIAEYLGEHFTDDGYVQYVANKYSLSEQDAKIMLYFMKSIHRYNIIRKPISYDEVIAKSRA